MTLEEKDALLASVIEEHYATQKHNPTCVPVVHLRDKGFDVSDTRNGLWRLKEKGVVKSYQHGWGFLELQNSKKVFVRTRTEEPDDGSDDFEAYSVEIDTKKLEHTASQKPNRAAKKEVVDFDTLNAAIHFGKKHYTFQKGRDNQVRLKLFRDLWERREVIYNNKVTRKGEPFPPGAIATRIGLVDSAQGFERNKEAKSKLDTLIKNLETNLQRGGIPIRIYKRGGIKLIAGAK